MSDTSPNSWRDFHPFPLTKAQKELLDFYNTHRAPRPIGTDNQNKGVVEAW